MIYNIMKDKKIIIEDFNGNVVKEQAVQFYEMKIDEKHFGQLTAVVYTP
ncbi:MAG: hypothetical protein K5685_14610 [Bacteroidales bacterium]|nr:hypothetical protein [Bacteroidales bacterium]